MSPEELKSHDLVGVDGISWQWIVDKEIVSPELSFRFNVNDYNFAKKLVSEDLGIAILPISVSHKEIVEGQLLPLLDWLPLNGSGIHLVYPERKLAPAKLKVFLDFVISWKDKEAAWKEFNRDVKEAARQASGKN